MPKTSSAITDNATGDLVTGLCTGNLAGSMVDRFPGLGLVGPRIELMPI